MSEGGDPAARASVTFSVNGKRRELQVEPRWLLYDVLRHRLGLTGTHVGCEHALSDALGVPVDRVPVLAMDLYELIEGAGRR